MKPRYFLAILLLVLAAPPALSSMIEVEPIPSPPAGLIMQAVEERKQSPLEPKLGHGVVVASPKDWPATFSAEYVVNNKTYVCTSSLVAPQVLISAAHCMGSDGTMRFRKNREEYVATCAKTDPGYPALMSADWAICKVDRPVPTDSYERISVDPARIYANARLLLTGLGCTRIGAKPDGKFRTGYAKIQQLPGQVAGHPHWVATYPAAGTTNAFLCEGDSGGAAYSVGPTGLRTIVAINSHRDKDGRGISYLSPLSLTVIGSFIDDWRKKNGDLKICGLQDDAPNCRT